MEDAGQYNQQVNRAAAFTVLHAADMLLACQAQANRQFLLRNATGSANIVKSNTYVSPSAQPVQNRTDGRSKKEPHDGEEKILCR